MNADRPLWIRVLVEYVFTETTCFIFMPLAAILSFTALGITLWYTRKRRNSIEESEGFHSLGSGNTDEEEP